jgi:hypothetical protein
MPASPQVSPSPQLAFWQHERSSVPHVPDPVSAASGAMPVSAPASPVVVLSGAA